MKNCVHPFTSLLVLALISACTVRADSAAFWSFDTAADGNGSFSSIVTASTFASTPTLSITGSSLVIGGAGGATFTAFDASTWQASGTGATPGHSMGWLSGSTGNHFDVTLNTTGLSSLQVRMDIRSFTGGLTQFSSLTYSLDGGSTFVSSGLTETFSTTTSAYTPKSYSLSSLTEIDNQSSVILRWSLADTTQSLRIDNLQITAMTAVPEPAASGVMAGMATILAVVYFRRQRMASARTSL